MITQLTSSLNAFSYIFDCSLYIGITGVVGFFVTNFKDLQPYFESYIFTPLNNIGFGLVKIIPVTL